MKIEHACTQKEKLVNYFKWKHVLFKKMKCFLLMKHIFSTCYLSRVLKRLALDILFAF